jgi:hypothetical protein
MNIRTLFLSIIIVLGVWFVTSLLIREKGQTYPSVALVLSSSGAATQVFVSQLKLPIRRGNRPLPVEEFQLVNEKLTLEKKISTISGVHFRNMFQLSTPDATFVYFIDHGLDTKPFPGGNVFRYNLTNDEVYSFPELKGKFNFAGSANFYQGSTYEVFVGIDYGPRIYINGRSSHQLADFFADKSQYRGFTAALFFELSGQLYLFLGMDEFRGADNEVQEYQDYFFFYSDEQWVPMPVDRPVPVNWTTVYSAPAWLGDQLVIKVAYHSPDLNSGLVGIYDPTTLQFSKIADTRELGLANQWIAHFEMVHRSGSTTTFLPTYGGSGGAHAVLVNLHGEDVEIDEEFVLTFFESEGQLRALTRDFKVLNLGDAH